MNDMENKENDWNNSFKNKDNFLFYPHEEVIRFVNKYLSKRTGYNENVSLKQDLKMLDLGCGIGRHVVYGHENNIDTYGFDLSLEAINYAQEFAKYREIDRVKEKLIVSDARSLPWGDSFFSAVISHGTLDSMPFEIATASVEEIYRVTKQNALFYCDLITDEDGTASNEVIVDSAHEKGTIQSFFSRDKINDLICEYFKIIEININHRININTNSKSSRWHLVLERNDL